MGLLLCSGAIHARSDPARGQPLARSESAAFVNALSDMWDVLDEFVPGTYDLVIDTGRH